MALPQPVVDFPTLRFNVQFSVYITAIIRQEERDGSKLLVKLEQLPRTNLPLDIILQVMSRSGDNYMPDALTGSVQTSLPKEASHDIRVPISRRRPGINVSIDLLSPDQTFPGRPIKPSQPDHNIVSHDLIPTAGKNQDSVLIGTFSPRAPARYRLEDSEGISKLISHAQWPPEAFIRATELVELFDVLVRLLVAEEDAPDELGV